MLRALLALALLLLAPAANAAAPDGAGWEQTEAGSLTFHHRSRDAGLALALAKAGREMMKGRNGSLLTLSYLGAERTMPNYNVMGMAKASLEAGVRYLATSLGPEGTRVNAISAGPIRTLAASGIKSFRKMLSHNPAQTPLRRNVTIEEVGNVGAFLCSDLASGMSGEITYVDGGFNITAMGGLED